MQWCCSVQSAGSSSSKSFFVGYDLPRNEVNLTGWDSGEERPRAEEKMLSIEWSEKAEKDFSLPALSKEEAGGEAGGWFT